MRVRKAREEDIRALLDIYNEEVLHGIATLDLRPRTFEEWQQWFVMHNKENHPLYVVEREDDSEQGTGLRPGKIAGYASLSPYREKEAYCSTVELSVYIGKEYRRQGAAAALMERILEEARRDERTHLVVSVITAGNEASTCLHEKFGFTYCGTIREVGMKFGRYLDIENYSLPVG